MLNRAVLIGRLTRDPEVRITKREGKERAVVRFTVAYNRRYKVGEEWREESHFFDVRAYGNLAKVIGERYKKGDMVFVEGRLSQDRWETVEGRRTKITIVADTVRLIKAKGETVTVEDTNGKEEEEENVGI